MAFALVVEVTQNQCHAAVRVIIDAIMKSGRHCFLYDRSRFENEFLIFDIDKQIIGLEFAVGAPHDYTDLVYRCITGSEPFPDGRFELKFPEIAFLARLPLAFVNVLVPLRLDIHPFRLNDSDVGVNVLVVVIERRRLVRPVIKYARRISLRQFRYREKSCS